MVELLNIALEHNLTKLKTFIIKQNLFFDKDIDTCLIIKENDNIVACACKKDNIFKMIAVDESYQSNNYVATLLSELINISYSQGYSHFFIYTKMMYQNIFVSFGFKLIVYYQEIGFFEKGSIDINSYYLDYYNDNTNKGCIVMNANPFTKGHYFLIKEALKKVDFLYVFVVEEDKSFFNFKTRFKLIKEATKHLNNILVIPSGPYIISQATFPTYFLKNLNDASEYYANIDGLTFKKIMNLLNINYRFVGNEPLDNLTNYYNSCLKNILHDQLIIIERLSNEEDIISASKVRMLLTNKEFNKIKNYVLSCNYQDIIEYGEKYDNK
ncbi:MAG: adenylyltransferase/cytidyltransferase family protein [Bacilli bacterium]|jgi:[citrate (pro-3S)-lyase] ligase|nr:adenylyltransferase/cytidyltransferase family protein [Bacilli bacterium]